MTGFPGKDKILFWQERKRLKQEIRRTLLAAMTLAQNPKDRIIVEKFIECIEPGLLIDLGKLPYIPNMKGNAKDPVRIHCVFALIACLISAYWEYIATENPDDIMPCRGYIEMLQATCDTYDSMKLWGDPAKGWWLE